MGADVIGADASRTNVEVASRSTPNKRGVRCPATRPLRRKSSQRAANAFDVVLNMEVVEHVADVDLFLNSCAEMVKPGGLMFIATINRTMKAMALAIVGAEYVLRWLPRGTHQYEKLVRPGGD
jgi:2-polyprenyl-6-hydroxyphenyl methylase/3-demethylubiquinone-9 3-methyltransferase